MPPTPLLLGIALLGQALAAPASNAAGLASYTDETRGIHINSDVTHDRCEACVRAEEELVRQYGVLESRITKWRVATDNYNNARNQTEDAKAAENRAIADSEGHRRKVLSDVGGARDSGERDADWFKAFDEKVRAWRKRELARNDANDAWKNAKDYQQKNDTAAKTALARKNLQEGVVQKSTTAKDVACAPMRENGPSSAIPPPGSALLPPPGSVGSALLPPPGSVGSALLPPPGSVGSESAVGMKTPSAPPLKECGHNCCPDSHPYMKEWHAKKDGVRVPSGKMWCYTDPAGYPNPCRMANSGFAPPTGFEWGQNQADCKGAYRHPPLKSCDDLKCCPGRYVKEWYDKEKGKPSGAMWCYPNKNSMSHPCRMTASGFAPPSGYRWGQNQPDCKL